MAYLARADSGGVALSIAIGSGCTLTLQRLDFKPDQTLARHFGRELSAQDLQSLIPNWSKLTWWTHGAGPFLPTEWTATAEPYALRLTHSSPVADTREVIDAFNRLMRG